MKPLIVLFLILLTISNINGRDYSIVTFLNELEKDGIFNLLVEIKRYLGCDVSISFCKRLYPTRGCETVVKVYIGGCNDNINVDDKVAKPLDLIIESYKVELNNAGFTNYNFDKFIKSNSY